MNEDRHSLTNANDEPDKYPELGFEIITMALLDFQANPIDQTTKKWFDTRGVAVGEYGWCLEVSSLNPNCIRKLIEQIEAGFFFSRAEVHAMLKNPRNSAKVWERNAAIRARYDELKNNGAPSDDAMTLIAAETNLGKATVKRILYNPRSFCMTKHPGVPKS